jgi:hypothetical protein
VSDAAQLAGFRLLRAFRQLFEGRVYRHRASTQGDVVAIELYEDLVSVGRSARFVEAVRRGDRVLNLRNVRRGVRARRGDATFGQLIPGETAVAVPGCAVSRGPIATVEIGVEVKILAKAMIKQIDRVISDLGRQVEQFRRGGGNPISVGIVGVNHAHRYVSYEGRRKFPTSGQGGRPHPHQEAAEAERRLRADAAPNFDEFLVLKFRAPNERPFSFEWVDYDEVRLDCAAALARISNLYQQRF